MTNCIRCGDECENYESEFCNSCQTKPRENSISELKTLKDMHLFFSQRKKLEKEFYEYTKKDRIDNTIISDCPMNVIGWFYGKRDEHLKQESIKIFKNLQSPETIYPLILDNFPEEKKGDCAKTLWNDTNFRYGTEYGMLAMLYWLMNLEEYLK